MFKICLAGARVRLLSMVSVAALNPVAAAAEAPAGEVSTQAADEIVVVGRSLGRDVAEALPVQFLAGDELAHRRLGGLGETLAGLPGIHLDNFGGGASRPVIRGQTVPRIEVLSDGANLFDVSSVSPDHAITTDPLLLDAIEIQRGPAAARYGGNALNGAINLIDSKVPRRVPAGGITGAAEARFGTGDEEKTVVGRITAGLGQFAVHAEGARRAAENYDVPDAYGSDKLRDSFAQSSSYAAGASWITSNGYLGASYSRLESRYGLPGHSHANGVCHLHAPDLHCEPHGSLIDPFEGLNDADTAYIDLESERVDVRADYDKLLPGLEHARLRLSYTDYGHDEIDGRTLFSRFTNEVYDARLELTHAPLLGFTGTLGGQYTDGTFSGLDANDLHLPPEDQRGFIKMRDVSTENIAVFLSERRAIGPVDVELAGRYDWRRSRPTYPAFEEVYGLTREAAMALPPFVRNLLLNEYDQLITFREARHELLSLSASANWNIGNGYSAALSMARSERAPSVRELYAGSNNLATNSYEIGLLRTQLLGAGFGSNSPGITERAKSIDLTLRKADGPLGFEVGLFYQDIGDYVFARFLEEENETGVPQRLLLYTASDVRFMGLDGELSYRFTPQSRVTLFGDYVDAKLESEDDNVPRIPPGRLGARYEHTAGPIAGNVEYYHTFDQDKVAAYETPTPGYDIVNATLAYRFDLGRARQVEFYVRGTNLLNALAFVHTSFVKDQSPLRGRSFVLGMRHAF